MTPEHAPQPSPAQATPQGPARPRSARWRPLWWALALLALATAAVLAWVYWQPLWAFGQEIWRALKDKEAFRQRILAFGPWAPAVFIIFQISQVFIAPIPGELVGAVGGYVFGWLPAMIYSTIGLSVGSWINFSVARAVGRSFVERTIPPQYLERVSYLMERQGVMASFIFFVIPGFPKDYLCFILGLSPMSLRTFLLVCLIGRLPGTLMLSLQGCLVYQEDYWSFLWLGLLSIAFIAPVYIWREPIYRWLYHLEKGRGPLPEPAPPDADQPEQR
ncbi:MAG: TVP38/TMEM64 family protein [Pseudomonadota bacterium]